MAITELKMTVELPVNITKPLYEEIPAYQTSFRLKFPGLLQVKYALQISSKTNCHFATPVFPQQNDIPANEDQNVYLKHSVMA